MRSDEPQCAHVRQCVTRAVASFTKSPSLRRLLTRGLGRLTRNTWRRATHLGAAFGWPAPGKRGLSASYCLSYTNTLVESGWPLTDTPFDVTVIVLPSADNVFVPV
jgi:hypothetical protein